MKRGPALAALAGVLLIGTAVLSGGEDVSATAAPRIDNVFTFLEQCPTNDPMYAQIRADFELRKEGVPVGTISCTEPVSAMPVAQLTDELIIAQALRAIYYMEGGRTVAYPWTSGSHYDWLKTKIGGIDIRNSGSSCCEQFNGKWTAMIVAQNQWDRDFSRQWAGLSYRISLITHEARHVDGFPHVGGCPLFPDSEFGCDPTYDESNISPYATQWWLNARWLSGEINVGYACQGAAVAADIAEWLMQFANSEYRGRFLTNNPPVLSMPAQPGGVCPASTQTPTPAPTPSPTAAQTASPTATPSPTPTPSPGPTKTPSPTPSAPATPTPTSTPTPAPTPTPTPTATPSPAATASPAPTPSASPALTPSASTTPTPTPTLLPPPGPTLTPSPSASALPSASPTPTPAVTAPPQANANCDAAIDTQDAILMLEAAGSIEYDMAPGCPAPGEPAGGTRAGDANCDGSFDVRDVLALLRYLSGTTRSSCGS